MRSLLERYGIESDELARRLGVTPAAVEAILDRPRPAPAVMLDGEEALSGDPNAAGDAAQSAGRVLANAAWNARTMRLWRPTSFAEGRPLRELKRLAAAIDEHGGGLPLDAVVLPKAVSRDQIHRLDEGLSKVERRAGVGRNSVRVALMVERAAAVAHLPDLVEAAKPRLCALIFGAADYARDLGLVPTGESPTLDWARSAIVNAAGAAGVPAIGEMTLDYPVADPALDAAQNRERFLSRVTLAYENARRAARFGMSGMLVGHPAQLVAALLAFDAAVPGETLEQLAADVAAYRDASAAGRGVVAIRGRMADRATDRAARAVLRRAVARGGFDRELAIELGIVGPEEGVGSD